MYPNEPSTNPDQPVDPSFAAPAFAAAQPYRTGVLLGPLGLRAGWGIALFLIVSTLLGTIFFFAAAKAEGRLKAIKSDMRDNREAAAKAKAAHLPPPIQALKLSVALAQESGVTAAALLTAFCIAFLERRRFGVYGLGLRHVRDALPGAAWGLASMAAIVGMLRVMHLLVFDGRLLTGGAILRFGSLWLLNFLLVGVFEEFFFRGYVQFTLTRGLLGLGRRLSPEHARRTAFWITAVLVSLLFGLAHTANGGETAIGLLSVVLAGLVFSYALWRTGSLWWAIGFHMTWDWSQSFLYGTPDSGFLSVGRLFATHAAGRPLLSGGADGPEGSLLAIPIFLLMIGMIHLQPQAEQPPVEPLSLPFAGIEAAPGAPA